MSTWLVLACTAAYALTAVDLWYRGDHGHAVMFAGYTCGNVGLLMALK